MYKFFPILHSSLCTTLIFIYLCIIVKESIFVLFIIFLLFEIRKVYETEATGLASPWKVTREIARTIFKIPPIVCDLCIALIRETSGVNHNFARSLFPRVFLAYNKAHVGND